MTQEMALIKFDPQADLTLMAFYEEAQGLLRYAETLVIQEVKDLTFITNDLTLIAKVMKGMEEKRKEYLKPFQDHVKETNEAYKALMEPIKQADKITRDKILTFRAEQERKRREAEAIEAEKLALARREAELKGGEITVDLTPVAKPEAVPDRIHTELGSTGMRDNWQYEVIDFGILPNEYKLPDTAMLNSIAKKYHDQKSITGVRFFNKPILAVNAR